MRKVNIKVVVSILFLTFLIDSAFALTIIDSAGRAVEIEKAERIVCLSTDCLEAVIILGEKERIVGLGTNALQKPFSPNVVDVGKWSDPNIEAIVSLNPDIVITYVQWPEREKLEEKLGGTGIKVVRLDFYKINTIFDEFVVLGKILGKEERAKEIAEYWKSQLDLIKSRTEGLKKVKVYWESYSDYSAAGGGTGWNDIIQIAGGENVFGNESGYPKVDAEKIIAKNPDVFIKSVSSSAFQPYRANNSKIAEFYEKLISRPEINQTAAGKNGRVYAICMEMLHGTFGLIAETAYVAKLLHPEEFSALEPRELHRKYIESLGMEFSGVWIYPELQAERENKNEKLAPGFEAILAMLAVAIILALRKEKT
ncbi:MAG: ABC transporter substrate-binding protein [Archaeoglobales archaeon]|nr:ABC transporter substrate-binding protein [Archaeoglobales archaeon]